MTTTRSAWVVAAAVALLSLGTACDSDGDSGSEAASATSMVTTASTSTQRTLPTSVGATASSVIGSALDTAQQSIQNAINAAIAAAPITFDEGSSDLSTIDEVTLKAVALPLKGNDTRVRVTTYARSDSTSEAKSLAEARADNVVAALAAEGVDEGRITVRAEANPSDESVEVNQASIEVVAD